ncbi:MAG: helicase C-terminal domain-containing protein [Gemmatimonadota bacterium]
MSPRPVLTLPPATAERIREEIRKAGGQEVTFLAEVDALGAVENPRAVARGNRTAVLAVARDAPQGGVLIHNHPSGILEPSDADLAVATRLFEEGLGSAIVDNGASRLYVVVEPPETRKRVELEPDEVEALVAPGGQLSTLHPGYEDRPGQRTMVRAVVEAFNRGGVRVVEAGTGTGKSLAYLLPAARWAAENGERTVISTNTIHLQEQLTGKDLPLVARLTGVEVKWALVKGRGNYVSIRRARLAASTQEQLFPSDRSSEITSLLEWLGNTEDGSLSDLANPPSDEVWDEVRSDGDVCLRARCPHFQACFYQKARRRAASAEILVVNHHLLFSDLAVRRGVGGFGQSAVLPPFRHLVLDEAHNVEDAATSHLGAEVSRQGLFRTLSRLDRGGKGVLAAVEEGLRGRGDGVEARALLERVEGRVRPALERARSALSVFFDALDPRVPDPQEGPVRLQPPGEGRGMLDDPPLHEALERLLEDMSHLRRELRAMRERVEEGLEWREALEERMLDLASVEYRVEAAGTALRVILQPDPQEAPHSLVRWMEGRRARGGGRSVALAAAPVEPGDLLRKELFQHMETAVLTSATLTTRKGSFTHVRERLGLASLDASGGMVMDGEGVDGDEEGPADQEGLRVEELQLSSPFDFATQSILAVPMDLSGATDRGQNGDGAKASEATVTVVKEMARITDGGIFVLFTSHRALRDVAHRLRREGVEGRHPLYVQGEGPRSWLLREFTASGSGILLGNAAFWEGVDVPGDPLRGMVIQKIPFRVPTEPITAARLDALEARGRNAFWEYMLPQAALRLKQGFGRLIRARSDRGAVVLLDSRIVSSRYGRVLRDSLPPAPLIRGPWAEVAPQVEAFYRGGVEV